MNHRGAVADRRWTLGGVPIANRVVLAPLAGIGNWFVRLQASATARDSPSRRWSRASPCTTATSAPAGAAADPSRRAPGVGSAVRSRPGCDGLGGRTRGRGRRRPDRHQHGLSGAKVCKTGRGRRCSRSRAGGGARSGGRARQRAAGDGQAPLGRGRATQRGRDSPPAGERGRGGRAVHSSPSRLPASRRDARLRAGPRAGAGAPGPGVISGGLHTAEAGARGVRATGAAGVRWPGARWAIPGCSSSCSGRGAGDPTAEIPAELDWVIDRAREHSGLSGRSATCASSIPGTSSASAVATLQAALQQAPTLEDARELFDRRRLRQRVVGSPRSGQADLGEHAPVFTDCP